MDIDEREAAIASLKRKKELATKEVHILSYVYNIIPKCLASIRYMEGSHSLTF